MPYENWLNEEIKKNQLINEAIVLEALRVPGNKVVLTENFAGKEELVHNKSTWGLRWSSNFHPREKFAESEIRWFHSSDYIDMEELFSWTVDVMGRNRLAEVLIVDNEQAVVTYNITSENQEVTPQKQ